MQLAFGVHVIKDGGIWVVQQYEQIVQYRMAIEGTLKGCFRLA